LRTTLRRKKAMSHWKNYTPEELERQYDNRAAVPDHPEIFGEWDRRSSTVSEQGSGGRDLAYGPHPRQTLDIFVPDGLSNNLAGPPPLHVFLHGGYWQAMSKESSGFVAEGLVQAGVAVAVVNYRLSPEVSIKDIIEDVRNALAWLYVNGTSHGVDGTKIQVSGHSAGGHLVAMLWATDWSLHPAGIPSGILHSGIAISGLFELEPLVTTRVNNALGLDVSGARTLSPARVEPRSYAPLLLAVGEAESKEYHRQSELMYEAWGAAGVPVRLAVLDGHNHFSILDELASGEGTLCRAALQLWKGERQGERLKVKG
jgi:arylformamidase